MGCTNARGLLEINLFLFFYHFYLNCLLVLYSENEGSISITEKNRYENKNSLEIEILQKSNRACFSNAPIDDPLEPFSDMYVSIKSLYWS